MKSYNLFLIIRIDPYYYCSDYDLGGLPSWLLGDPQLNIKETGAVVISLNDPRFKLAYKNFLDSFLKLIHFFQASKKGPIIAFAVTHYSTVDKVSNDYMSFYNDFYVGFVRQILSSNGIVEMVVKSMSYCEMEAPNLKDVMAMSCHKDTKVYVPLTKEVYRHEEEEDMKRLFNQNLVSMLILEANCHGKSTNNI